MLMLLLGFVGLLVMFLFLLRTLAAQQALLRESFARQGALLTDLEGRFMEVLHQLRTGKDHPIGLKNGHCAAPPADLAELLEGASKLPPLNAPFASGKNGASQVGNGLELKMDPR